MFCNHTHRDVEKDKKTGGRLQVRRRLSDHTRRSGLSRLRVRLSLGVHPVRSDVQAGPVGSWRQAGQALPPGVVPTQTLPWGLGPLVC